MFEIKIPIDVKLVKLVFRLYFPKDIFKVFTSLQWKWKNVQIIKIIVYRFYQFYTYWYFHFKQPSSFSSSRYILYQVEAPLKDNKRSLLISMECGVSWFAFMWLIICFYAKILIICMLWSRYCWHWIISQHKLDHDSK